MTKSLILAALVASLAIVPSLAAAKGGHAHKAPHAGKSEPSKAPAKKA